MTPESLRFLSKARRCLYNARAMLGIGLGDDAGRSAYLAGFHAAKAFIFDHTGKIAKSHNGVKTMFTDLARRHPKMPPEFLPFLSHAYHLKEIADYETGEDIVPLETAERTIETATRFVNCIAVILETLPPSSPD